MENNKKNIKVNSSDEPEKNDLKSIKDMSEKLLYLVSRIDVKTLDYKNTLN